MAYHHTFIIHFPLQLIRESEINSDDNSKLGHLNNIKDTDFIYL